MERMMIVEDHSAFAQALGLVLGEGTRISLARTLEEGRTLIRAGEPFDVVVLDLSLPDGEGTELIPEIRHRHPRTRVAILSARDDMMRSPRRPGPTRRFPRRRRYRR